MPKLPKITSLQYLRKEVSDDVDFGRNFQNIRGVRSRLLERADNLENWRLLWKWGLSLFLLLYSSITLTVCVGNVKLPLLLVGYSVFSVSHARFSSKSLLS